MTQSTEIVVHIHRVLFCAAAAQSSMPTCAPADDAPDRQSDRPHRGRRPPPPARSPLLPPYPPPSPCSPPPTAPAAVGPAPPPSHRALVPCSASPPSRFCAPILHGARGRRSVGHPSPAGARRGRPRPHAAGWAAVGHPPPPLPPLSFICCSPRSPLQRFCLVGGFDTLPPHPHALSFSGPSPITPAAAERGRAAAAAAPPAVTAARRGGRRRGERRVVAAAAAAARRAADG